MHGLFYFMKDTKRECIYFVDNGKSCRETNVIEFVVKKQDDALYTKYYVACKEHADFLKEQKEANGFLVKVCEPQDKVKQCEIVQNYRETSKEVLLPILLQQEEGE